MLLLKEQAFREQNCSHCLVYIVGNIWKNILFVDGFYISQLFIHYFNSTIFTFVQVNLYVLRNFSFVFCLHGCKFLYSFCFFISLYLFAFFHSAFLFIYFAILKLYSRKQYLEDSTQALIVTCWLSEVHIRHASAFPKDWF